MYISGLAQFLCFLSGGLAHSGKYDKNDQKICQIKCDTTFELGQELKSTLTKIFYTNFLANLSIFRFPKIVDLF